MKSSVTILLCLTLVLLPVQPRADEPNNIETLAECALAIVVLTVGSIAIYQCVKMCRKLPPIDGPPPPATNAVPAQPIPTGCRVVTVRASTWGDSVSLRASNDLRRWEPAYRFWFGLPGNGSMIAVAYRAGCPAVTNVAPLVFTNGIYTASFDFSCLPLASGKFFMLADP